VKTAVQLLVRLPGDLTSGASHDQRGSLSPAGLRLAERGPRCVCGLTIDPGAGANTPGMAEEMRQMSRDGRAPRLVEPEEMVPPLPWVVSRAADQVNGRRFDASLWDPALPPEDAARQAGRPTGFEMHSAAGADASL